MLDVMDYLKYFFLFFILVSTLSFFTANEIDEVEVFDPNAGWYYNGYDSQDKCISIWSDKAFYELKNELAYVPEYVCGFDEEGKEQCNWVTRHDVKSQYFDAKIRIVNSCSTTKTSALDLYSTQTNIITKTREVDSIKTRITEKGVVTELLDNSWAKGQISLTKSVTASKDSVKFDSKDFKPVERINSFSIPANSEIVINKRITASGSGEFAVGFGGALLDPPYGSFSTNVIPIRPDALVAGYSFNGDANDFVGSNNGTVYGATLTTNRFGETDKAYDFNNLASNYISVPHNDSLVNNQMTWSFWVNRASYTSGGGFISKHTFDANGRGWNIYQPSISNSRISLTISQNGATAQEIHSNTGAISNDEWINFTIIFDNGQVSFFKNGIQYGTTQTSTQSGIYNNNTVNMIFGKGVTTYTNGKLDDVLIYNQALSSEEVSALYQYGRLVGGYGFDGDANDVSFNQNHGTVSGATLTTNRFGQANKAYDFNGAGDYIDLGNLKSQLSVDNNFSVSLWLNTNELKNSGIFSSTNGTNNRIALKLVGTTGTIAGGFYNGSWTAKSSTISINEWNHIVLIKNGNSFNMYINNSILTSTTAPNAASTQNTRIGSRTDGTEFFNGSIDDVAIFNYALSESEVEELYLRGNYLGTGDWIAPTTTLTKTKGTQENTEAITLTCQTTQGNCINTYYKINNQPYQLYTQPFLINNGTTNITYYSTDQNQNQETPILATIFVPTQGSIATCSIINFIPILLILLPINLLIGGVQFKKAIEQGNISPLTNYIVLTIVSVILILQVIPILC